MAGPTLTREGLGIPATWGRGGGGGGGLGSSGGGGYGGGGSVLTGAPPRGGSDASGHIPQVTNPATTVTGNLGNIGNIVGSVTAQQLEALRRQYPTEYFATLQQLLLNTQKRAGGDISDLLPELQVRNAEAGVAGGYSGSQMENTKLLRDLGLTRYGVEEQALKDLGLIQSGTPTVRPYDPTNVISGIINAQERADLYNAAPDPEAAYRRARDAARGSGGGGGGGGTPGVRYGGGGGGGGGSSVDDILRKYGSGMGGYGPPIIARGTRVGPLPDADYENVYQTGGSGWGSGGGNMSVDDFDAFADEYGGGFGGFDNYDEFGDNEDYGGYDDYDDAGDYGGGGDYGYEDYSGDVGGYDEDYMFA